jgi:hypothetical protein
VDEDVGDPVRIPGHEVGGDALEGHVAAVGGDRAVDAVAVPLHPGGVDAHELGRAAVAVADEDVIGPVRVPGDQVVGVAVEGHVAAVGGDREGVAVGIPLRPVRAEADAARYLTCGAFGPREEHHEPAHDRSESVHEDLLSRTKPDGFR